MKTKVTLKVAASTLIIGLTMVSCKSATVRPASAAAVAPNAEKGAAKLYAEAQAEFQKGRPAEALGLAEQLVELSPQDAGYRMLLADLYLKNGRFASAEATYADVLTLEPENKRAGLTRALTMIAQGKQGEALIALDGLAGRAEPADVGLAFALAGQTQRAVEMLEPAARAPEATGRVRQNLALAYALSGDWRKARTVASQDLSPDQVEKRLEQWASLANPSAPGTQVATLLGVSPVADSGQPVRLALAAPAADPKQAYAAADGSAPVETKPVQVASADPVAVGGPEEAPTSEGNQAFVYQPPEHGDVFAAPVEPASAASQAPSEPAKVSVPVASSQFAAAVDALVTEPVKSHPVAPVAKAPIMAFTPVKAAAKPRVSTGGRYVVQIGAYRNEAQVEQAWARAYKQYGFSDSQPMSTTVSIPGKGTFHRLAVSGFQKPAEAARLCQSIRNKGGACFVRATAGDAPVQWASRYSGRA